MTLKTCMVEGKNELLQLVLLTSTCVLWHTHSHTCTDIHTYAHTSTHAQMCIHTIHSIFFKEKELKREIMVPTTIWTDLEDFLLREIRPNIIHSNLQESANGQIQRGSRMLVISRSSMGRVSFFSINTSDCMYVSMI